MDPGKPAQRERREKRRTMKRCINCKKDIIPMGEKLFEGFHSIFPPKEFAQACYFVLSDGKTGPYFPFAQRSEKGSFWHLRVERGFWEEQIHLRISDVFVSYLQYDWETAMCTYKVLNNSRYGRLSSISKQYVVCSPWFVSENTKEGLDDALHQLGAWYQDHLAEIHLSYEKQQTWLDKQWGSDIQDIIVLPEYQRKGIGTLLLQKILLEYQHVYQKALLTDNTERTIQFYQSVGFIMDTDMNCRAFLKIY